MREMNLTEGHVFGRLIWFSLPMIAGNLLQQVYNLVDTLVVGRFIGPDALAAVGSSYTLMTFITSVIIGLCMGSGAFFSADYGAGNRMRLKEDIWHSFWFIFLVTAAIYAVVYPGTEWILAVLQTPDRIFDMTGEYVTVIFAGLIFVFFYNFFAFLLRGMGNSVVPLVFLGISSILNIVLDLWFVAGLSMGVSGAAWATVIAQAVSGLGIAVYSFVKVSELRFTPEDMKFSAARLKETAANDFATGIQQSVMNFGILMVQGLVNSFGTTVMAAFAAGVKIDTLAYMPAQEFGNAYSIFASQNYGAGKWDRIRSGVKAGLIQTETVNIFLGVLIISGRNLVVPMFIDTPTDSIIHYANGYLLAVVRSSREAGEIKVTFRAEGCEEQTVIIRTE